MISGGLGIGLSAVFALLGFFIIAPGMNNGLTSAFLAWTSGSILAVIGYCLYVPISFILIPLLMVAAASPAGALIGLKWLWKVIW